MSFLRNIRSKFHAYVTGPLKFMVIRTYLEERGYYLGLYGDYVSEGGRYRHHGTLVVCKKQPTGQEETPAVALYPTTDPDMIKLPDTPVMVTPLSATVDFGTIDVPMRIAFDNAKRAIRMLEAFTPPAPQKRVAAA